MCGDTGIEVFLYWLLIGGLFALIWFQRTLLDKNQALTVKILSDLKRVGAENAKLAAKLTEKYTGEVAR